MHDLGALGGSWAEGDAINNSDQIVGYSDTSGSSNPHAFRWTSSTGMVDLNTLIDPRNGWVLNFASGINDAGQICGGGTIGGQSHAFLLTPIPEPSSIVLAGLAAALGITIHCLRMKIKHDRNNRVVKPLMAS